MKVNNKRIVHVLIFVCGLFLFLLGYLMYFYVSTPNSMVLNPYNRRQWEYEKHIKRGTIYDANGIVLAETTADDDGGVSPRKYPQGNLYSHVVGFNSQLHGKAGLESEFNDPLIGNDPLRAILSFPLSETKDGNNLFLSIDNELQRYCYNQLGSDKGAIVVLEPATGRVLALVSKPDFPPAASDLEKQWGDITKREDSPLIPRATRGLYPPGSIWKILTVAAAYEAGLTGEVFDDEGYFVLKNGTVVENHHGTKYGSIGVSRGFAVSSNFVFCSLGQMLGERGLRGVASRFGVGQGIPFDVPIERSKLPAARMSDSDIALTAIGQGKLLITPMHAALMVAAVANGGVMMKPTLVDKITNPAGYIISETRPQELMYPISKDAAEYVKDLMVLSVREGTSAGAAVSGLQVAGKTGTAENEQPGKDHAWFVGFAPADEPRVAVCVLLEYSGGTGGGKAAPIAGRVMRRTMGM